MKREEIIIAIEALERRRATSFGIYEAKRLDVEIQKLNQLLKDRKTIGVDK